MSDDALSDAPAPRLDLICFGPPRARTDGEEPAADVAWRKHLALLIYLALSPEGTQSRDHLLGLLWPEKDEGRARHSLNEALRRLRKHLGPDRLISRGESVTLAGGNLDVDALRFERLIGSDPDGAARLLSGDFLDGLTLDDAPAFEEWAAGQRQRYRDRGAAALVTIGEAALQGSRFTEAQEAARRALALRPYSERAARLLMRAAALAGDAAIALAVFRDFTGRLTAELGEPVSRELSSLAERIRTQRWRRQSAVSSELEPPLVGRTAGLRETFACLLAGLTRGPRLLIVAGEPGAGKTRLLGECGDRLALEGAVVARARPLESDADIPWSTLRQVVRGGLMGAPGLSATAPDALGVLAAMVPELAERVPRREVPDRAAAATALAAVLRAVAEETPLGILIDDAHFADGATIAALESALAQLRDLPIAVAIAALPRAPESPRDLMRLESELGRAVRGAAVRLEPLGESDIRTLVDALAPWCAAGDQRERLSRRVTFETGGNPLLAVTLLRGLATASGLRPDALSWPPPRRTLEAPFPAGVSQLVRMAITARITELAEPARRILAAASIGGPALDLDLLIGLTDMSRDAIEEQLAVLERRHFIAFDGERYTFVAPLVATVARTECFTPGQVRALRLRAVQALEGRPDLESRILRLELVAELDAGSTTRGLALAMAQDALTAGAERTARRALLVAERCGGAQQGQQQRGQQG